MRFEELAEPFIADDEGLNRVDGLDRSHPLAGRLARDLTDDVPVAAQGDHPPVSVSGHRNDLDRPGHQHEQVRGQISLVAQDGTGLVDPGAASSRQVSLLTGGEQPPESFRGIGSRHACVTVERLGR
jgi:hypothetical protein